MRRSARLREYAVKEPPPKREKRPLPVEKARPLYAYSLENDVPVTSVLPDYSLLDDPSPTEHSSLLAYSLYTSRANWLACNMFTRYWQRRPRGQKLSQGEANVRDTMTKLCECTIEMGPHVFPARLFTVKDEAADKKAAEEAEKVAKAEAEKREKEQELLKKREAELAAQREAELAAQREAELPISPPVAAPNSGPVIEETSANENAAGEPTVNTTGPAASNSLGSEATSNRQISPKEDEPVVVQVIDKVESDHLPPTPPQSMGIVASNIICDSTQAGSVPQKNLENLTSDAPPQSEQSKEEPVVNFEGQQPAPQPVPQSIVQPGQPVLAFQPAPATLPSQSQQPLSSQIPASVPVPSSVPPPAPIAQPVQAPAPTAGERAVSNQMVVARLQKLAKRDQALNELMREVASGNAPPSTIARFQLYINKARSMDVGRKPPKTFTPRVSQPTVSSPAPVIKKPVRHIMLAFELDENPAERFLIDKQSILELTGDGVALVSFLYIQRSKRQPPVYTPVTIAIRDLMPRVFSTLERCFSPQEEVREEMSKTISEGIRSDSLYVWQAVEKADSVLMEKIKKCGPPMQAAHMWRRLARAKNLAGNQSTAGTGRQEGKAKVSTALKKESKLESKPGRPNSVGLSQNSGLQPQAHPPLVASHQLLPSEVKPEPVAAMPVSAPAGAVTQSLFSAPAVPNFPATSGPMPVPQPMPFVDTSSTAPAPASEQGAGAGAGAGAVPEVSRPAAPLDAAPVSLPARTPSHSPPATLVQPKLELPSLDSFVFPQGEMPPLPPSMRKQRENCESMDLD